jgi:hypothetical protein
MTQSHAFAKTWLKYLNNKILINGQNFFSQDIPDIEIKPLKTYLIKGNHLVQQTNELEIINFDQMKEKYGDEI